MKAIVRAARGALPFWNEKVFAERDFEAYCRTNRIAVVEHKTKFSGEYLLVHNRPVIVLDPHLIKAKRLWVWAHEIAHHLLHHPYSQFFGGTQRARNLFVEKLDFQANFIAAIALVPLLLVKTKSFGEINDEFGYPRELLNLRKDYYERYKI